MGSGPGELADRLLNSEEGNFGECKGELNFRGRAVGVLFYCFCANRVLTLKSFLGIITEFSESEEWVVKAVWERSECPGRMQLAAIISV